MNDPALSAMIREVLAEELDRIRAGLPEPTDAVRCEPVSITSDDDLNAFARHVLGLAGDAKTRSDIENGSKVFELEMGKTSGKQPQNQPAAAATHVHIIENGFVSERQIDRLPGTVKRLFIAKPVRLTPLARDRARQRGIVIERMEP